MVLKSKGKVPIELVVSWLAASAGIAPAAVWRMTFAEFALRVHAARLVRST